MQPGKTAAEQVNFFYERALEVLSEVRVAHDGNREACIIGKAMCDAYHAGRSTALEEMTQWLFETVKGAKTLVCNHCGFDHSVKLPCSQEAPSDNAYGGKMAHGGKPACSVCGSVQCDGFACSAGRPNA